MNKKKIYKHIDVSSGGSLIGVIDEEALIEINRDYQQTKEDILTERLQKANARLLYLDQLRPLIKTNKEGWMQKISFELMSEYATNWMRQEEIE